MEKSVSKDEFQNKLVSINIDESSTNEGYTQIAKKSL